METSTELVPNGRGEMELAQTSALEITIARAVEAQVRASVQARYALALNRPRDWDTVRVNLLKECKRPRFAEVARYRKPQGRTHIEGFSIRFVEAALRCMSNVYIETTVIYDDLSRRIVRVSVTDLEGNITPSQDVTVTKEVERHSADGREIIKVRQNKQGKTVYVVAATDDEILMKQNSLISKTKRSLGLSLLPGDIADEAHEVILKTQQESDGTDPAAQKKRLFDSFAEFSITPAEIKEYLGHEVTPQDLPPLRALYQAIKMGEVRWHETLADIRAGKESGGLTDQLADKAAKAKQTKPAPKTEQGRPTSARRPRNPVRPRHRRVMDSEIVLRLLNATLAYMMARDDLQQLRAQKAERCDIQAAALEVSKARQRLAGITRQAHHELRQ